MLAVLEEKKLAPARHNTATDKRLARSTTTRVQLSVEHDRAKVQGRVGCARHTYLGENSGPARMIMENLTPRPGIREHYLPEADIGKPWPTPLP
jgi:hypothetical protein